MLSGPGGNVVVLNGPDGKLVVDTFVRPAWPPLKRRSTRMGGADHDRDQHALALRSRRQQRELPQRQRGRSSRSNTKKRLSETARPARHALPARADRRAADRRRSTTRHKLYVNGEQVDLGYVPPAHTDTDITVASPKANVLHLGDLFFNGMYPFIDASTGGNINGMIAAADQALERSTRETKIVPGHGPLADRARADRYRDMLVTVRDRVAKLKAAGTDASRRRGQADRRPRRRRGARAS